MGFLDKHIPTLEGKDAERFLEMARQNEEGDNKVDFSEQIKAFEKIMKNSNIYNKKDFVKEYPIEKLSELGNNRIQDILEDLGMLDENGNCPYTAEEIFIAGMEYSIDISKKWLQENIDDDVLVKCGSVIKCMDANDFSEYFENAMK